MSLNVLYLGTITSTFIGITPFSLIFDLNTIYDAVDKKHTQIQRGHFVAGPGS